MRRSSTHPLRHLLGLLPELDDDMSVMMWRCTLELVDEDVNEVIHALDLNLDLDGDLVEAVHIPHKAHHVGDDEAALVCV